MSFPTVAVLGGTGRHGRGLVVRLARAGYPVIVGSRDAARASAAMADWNLPATVTTALPVDAAQRAPVVILAVPFDAVDGLIAQIGPHLADGALIVDVTVPLSFAGGRVALGTVPEGSAAEHVKARMPGHVRVAATFKTVPAELLHTLDARLDCDEFVCGDSPEARTEAAGLVGAIDGLRAVDIGPLSRAQSLEHLTLLAVAINRRHKIRDARFKVVGL